MMENLFPVKDSISTKQKILEAAIDLFSQNGFSAVSIREITKYVGIKESALYNHYKTKDEMLETIYTIFRNEQKQRSLPPVAMLDKILETVTPEAFLMQGFLNFKQTINNPLLVKIWRILNIEQFRDQRAREIILNDIYKGTIDFLEAAFKIMIKKGQIKNLDPRTLALEYQYPIFTVMTEYLLLKFDNRDTADLEQRVEQHIQYFIQNVKIH
jgi:AcrR family transcriptional regulator